MSKNLLPPVVLDYGTEVFYCVFRSFVTGQSSST